MGFDGRIAARFADLKRQGRGALIPYLEAYDPVKQKIIWKMPNRVYGASGTMVTASDIVFSGNHDGEFAAYDARTGRPLWRTDTQAIQQGQSSTTALKGSTEEAQFHASRQASAA